MTFREVSNKIKEKVSRTNPDIGVLCYQLSTSPSTVRQLIKGNSVMLYIFLDFLTEINLELRLNDQIITCHQAIMDYVKSVKPSKMPSGIPESTMRRFFAGENVNVSRVFRILESLGIEVRVV